MAYNLNPCKCCGSSKSVQIIKIVGGVSGYVVECKKCNKRTELCYSISSAEGKWNAIAGRR